jgi:3-dehydroquinate dehydratase-2
VQVLVLNGVNLDMIGRRDPALYGGLSLNELETRIYEWAHELRLTVRCRQTNMEGEFVAWIHAAYRDVDAVIVNPGAWTHYSYAIHDALEMLEMPIVEVHLSNVDGREEWRQRSVLSDLVTHRVVGKGPEGYREALAYLAEQAATT